MIETRTKTIDGTEFRTTQLPAMRAYPMFIRLGKIIGPILGSLQGVSLHTELSELGSALGPAFSAIDPDEATRLMVDMFVSTRALVDGKVLDLSSEASINRVFTGRLPLMFKVLAFVVQENFADFFAGSGSAPTAPEAPAASLS